MFACESTLHSAGAVSYTHLDVYKRQVLDNITFAPIEHKLMTKEKAEKLGMELLDKVEMCIRDSG